MPRPVNRGARLRRALRRGLNLAADGVVAAAADRAARLREAPETGAGWLDRLVRASLWRRARRGEEQDFLALHHRRVWQTRRGDIYYAAAGRRPVIPRRLEIEELFGRWIRCASELGARHVVEIGCGDGRMLDWVYALQPDFESFTGIDLHEGRTEANRSHLTERPFVFEAGDYRPWLRAHGQSGCLILSLGGVLEYLGRQELGTFFEQCKELAPVALCLIEPLQRDHDLSSDNDSRTFGLEGTFSHNYPKLLSDADWKIRDRLERAEGDVRWLALYAEFTGASAH